MQINNRIAVLDRYLGTFFILLSSYSSCNIVISGEAVHFIYTLISEVYCKVNLLGFYLSPNRWSHSGGLKTLKHSRKFWYPCRLASWRGRTIGRSAESTRPTDLLTNDIIILLLFLDLLLCFNNNHHRGNWIFSEQRSNFRRNLVKYIKID